MENTCCNNHDEKKLESIANILKVIAEPNRLKIICFLSKEKKCVCEIEKNFNLKQNLISHHLKILQDKGLIICEKKAQWRYYFLNKDMIKNFTLIFKEILSFNN